MKRLYTKNIDQTPIKEKVILKSLFLPIDILLIFIATILCVIFIITPVLSGTTTRIILGLIFILFLPGYSLISALFPKKNDLDKVERIALSFGLSIAVTVLMGLLLNYTPFGIRLIPCLFSLSIFTALMGSIAYIRRWKVPKGDRFTIKFQHYFNYIPRVFKQKSKIDKYLSIVLIISIIFAISMTVYSITTPKPDEKFTEFYILGSHGKASDYPTNLTVGKKGTILVGIVNHEYNQITYNIVLKLNGKTIKNENISLSHNEKLEKRYTFNASQKGKNQKLEVLLYKLPNNFNVYKSLHLWINVN